MLAREISNQMSGEVVIEIAVVESVCSDISYDEQQQQAQTRSHIRRLFIDTCKFEEQSTRKIR